MENRQNGTPRQERRQGHGQEHGQTKILLLGCNFCNDGKYDRSDSIIVASIDRKTGSVKLASILRDIWVDLHEYGMDKINGALSNGGPEFAVKIINEYFHQNIRYYALVDMYGLINIIDLLGGVDIEITEMERIFLNCWVRDLAVQFKDGIIPPYIEKAGMVHMDGRTALSHARNRAIGTDFTRTGRQRTVLKAMARKIREKPDLMQLIKLFFQSTKYVKTNLSPAHIAALGIPVLKAKGADISSIHIPADNTYKICRDGQWRLEIDFEENIKELERFFSGQS